MHYKKYEFCKSVECEKLKIKCTVSNPSECIYSAKTFHKWLQDKGYSIIDRTELNSEITTIKDILHLFRQFTKDLKAGDDTEVKFRDVVLPYVKSMAEVITSFKHMKGK